MLSSLGICRKNGQRICTSHVCAMEEQFHEHVGSEPWRRQKEALRDALCPVQKLFHSVNSSGALLLHGH